MSIVYKPIGRGAWGAKHAIDIELSKINWSLSNAVFLLKYNTGTRQYSLIPGSEIRPLKRLCYISSWRFSSTYRFKTDHSIISHDRSRVTAAINIGNEIDIHSFNFQWIHFRSFTPYSCRPQFESYRRTRHLQKRSCAGVALFAMVWITRIMYNASLLPYQKYQSVLLAFTLTSTKKTGSRL